MLTSLKNYLKQQETDKIIQLISDMPQLLDKKDENNTTAFAIIAYSGNAEAFEVAKTLKNSLNFHETILCGDLAKVADHINKDNDLVNTFSEDGFSPIALATFFDHTEIAKLLLASGGDPGLSATNLSKVNALHSAVAKQNIALCQLYIDHGVNVNATQTQNITPLHSAAHLGNLAIVKLLVENGANIHAKTDNGDDAISFAQKDNHYEVQQYLEGKI